MPTLADLTTMRVGGPASRMVTATTTAELVDAATTSWAEDEATLVLGGGSNVLVGDDGFEGTVIHVATRGIERLNDAGRAVGPAFPATDAERLRSLSRSLRPPAGRPQVRLRVAAGEPWDDLVALTVEQGLAGIEALSGVPGSCGAAPIQNIGAYGQELAATLAAVEFLDRETGDVSRIPASQLQLGYRTSTFKQGRAGVVLSIELLLTEVGASSAQSAPVVYKQLADALGVPPGTRVPLGLLRGTVLELRRSKGMVLDPDDPESVSVGSFFTNPIVSTSFARTLPVGCAALADDGRRARDRGAARCAAAAVAVPDSRAARQGVRGVADRARRDPAGVLTPRVAGQGLDKTHARHRQRRGSDRGAGRGARPLHPQSRADRVRRPAPAGAQPDRALALARFRRRGPK